MKKERSSPMITSSVSEDVVRTANYVRLVGSVLSKQIIAGDLIRLRVAVNSGWNQEGVCYPFVYFYGREAIECIDDAIQITEDQKPRVEIIGFMQTSRRTYSENGESGVDYYQDIVGTSIGFAKNTMESVFTVPGIGRIKAQPVNQFVCFGKVVNTYTRRIDGKTYRYVTVKTWHNGFANFPQIICQGVAVNRSAAALREGDYAVVVGEVFNRKTVVRGHIRVKEFLYASDIYKVDESDISTMSPTIPTISLDELIYKKE